MAKEDDLEPLDSLDAERGGAEDAGADPEAVEDSRVRAADPPLRAEPLDLPPGVTYVEAPEDAEELPPEPPHTRAARMQATPAKRGGWDYPGRPTPTGTIEFEGKTWPVVRNCSWDEETYVAHEMSVTREQMELGLLKEVIETREGPGKGKGRMWRTERYARWRYHGFLAGEIASL